MQNEINFFDGETIAGKYVLLSNQNKNIFNRDGLKLKDCLDFLFLNSNAKQNYFFRIDYDINMILSKTKIDDRMISFFTEGEEYIIEGYQLKYFRHKILYIKKNGKQRTFYDISNFYRTSFIKTLEELNIKISEKQKNFLTEQKNKRSFFNLKEIEKIKTYTFLECNLGIEMVKKIKEILPAKFNLNEAGLYGSSALAQKFMKNRKIDKKLFLYKEKFNTDFFKSVYFGGRMEVFKIGTFKNCWKYDLNSAYPSVIKTLKIPLSYKQEKFKGKTFIKDENLYKVNYEIFDNDLIGLLPHRLKNGYLIFPKRGLGWFYGCEIKQLINYSKKYAVDFKITDEIEIKFSKEQLFEKNEIEQLYKLKALNNKQSYIYKICLNSIYGKFAQKVGTPQFQNIYLAGLITAKIRSLLLDVSIDAVYDIISFATDGIITSKKLKVKNSNNLGEWKISKIKEGIVFMAGIYYLINLKNEVEIGERGFKLEYEKLLEHFKKDYKITVKNKIFVSNLYFKYTYKHNKKNRCLIINDKKELNVLNNVKRLFEIKKNNFSIKKQYTSKLVDVKDFNKKISINDLKKEIEKYEL